MRVICPDVSTTGRLSKESCRNQLTNDRVALLVGESPEPLDLASRQSKPWHFQVLTTHKLSPLLCRHPTRDGLGVPQWY